MFLACGTSQVALDTSADNALVYLLLLRIESCMNSRQTSRGVWVLRWLARQSWVLQVQPLELCRQRGSVSPGSAGGSSLGCFPDVQRCHRCMSACLWYIRTHAGLTHSLAQVCVCLWVKHQDIVQQAAWPCAVSEWFSSVSCNIFFFFCVCYSTGLVCSSSRTSGLWNWYW